MPMKAQVSFELRSSWKIPTCDSQGR